MTIQKNIKVFEYKGHALIFNPQEVTLKLLPLQELLLQDQGNNEQQKQRVAEITRLVLDQEQEISGASGAVHLQELQSHGYFSRENSTDYTKLQTDIDINEDPRPALDRITLAVSNKCNMACTYCYAAQGTYYNMPGMMMSKETALNAINRASKAYSSIRHINFFGGEPTLNKEIIELVCEYVIYLHNQGILKNLPSFGITTNGYFLDARVLEMLDAYGFSVTVSVDGPKEIHDRKRPTISGKGTYDNIVKNIKTMIDRGIDLEFEATYTLDHLQYGIDLVTLLDFFYDTFHCKTLHCPIVAARPDSPEIIPLETWLKLNEEAIQYSIRNLVQGIPKSISLATRLMNHLAAGNPIHNYCPAGRSAVTINADGNIYACFMLMRNPEERFGNVFRMKNMISHPNNIEAIIVGADKKNNPPCQNCWAQPLCYGCLGEDLQRYGEAIIRSEIQGISSLCDFKRNIVEVFLKAVAEAYLSLNGQHKQDFPNVAV